MTRASGSILGDYRVLGALGDKGALLGETASGRRVVLKRLNPDYLWKGGLHPIMRDRMNRLRELAHPRVATLISVVRDDEQTWCVWEYLPGRSLAQWLGESPDPSRRLAMRTELEMLVSMMHALGIVHGALHEHQCIVGDDAKPGLTHVSPLMHDDPQVDRDALQRMFPGDESRKTTENQVPSSTDRAPRIRRRALIGAAVVLCLAMIAAWWIADKVRQARPVPAQPLQADPRLLEPSTPSTSGR